MKIDDFNFKCCKCKREHTIHFEDIFVPLRFWIGFPVRLNVYPDKTLCECGKIHHISFKVCRYFWNIELTPYIVGR